MRPTYLRLCFPLLLIALSGLSGAGPVRAACEQDEKVRVTVIPILATDKNTDVCPMLKCLAEEVRKKYPHLTGFKQGAQSVRSLAVGKEGTFDLVEKQTIRVTVVHAADPDNKVCLMVKVPRCGEITYTSACGKFLPIVTKYQTGEQETLIIAVRVEPCRGKK